MTKKRKTHRMETRLARDTGPCEPRTLCGRVAEGLALAEYGTVPSCKIWVKCPWCSGTGDNHQGTIPILAPPPCLRHRAIAAERARFEVNQRRDQWTPQIFDMIDTRYFD